MVLKQSIKSKLNQTSTNVFHILRAPYLNTQRSSRIYQILDSFDSIVFHGVKLKNKLSIIKVRKKYTPLEKHTKLIGPIPCTFILVNRWRDNLLCKSLLMGVIKLKKSRFILESLINREDQISQVIPLATSLSRYVWTCHCLNQINEDFNL